MNKKLLLFGGIAAALVVLYLLFRQGAVANANAAQLAALNQPVPQPGYPVEQSTTDQVLNGLNSSGIISALTSSDGFSNFFSSFGGANDPGLVDSTNTSLNDPGLESDYTD